MKFLPYAMLFLIVPACLIDRSMQALTTPERETLRIYQNLPANSNVTIAEETEPGERLALCLTLVDKETRAPQAGQKILFYHTSSTGEYQPADPADESTARLHGTATTDSLGRVFVETILPGDYGSSTDNRHIHTTVYGAHPEAYDIHFKQYTSYMGTRFANSSTQHFLADLKKTKAGTLVVFLTLEIRR